MHLNVVDCNSTIYKSVYKLENNKIIYYISTEPIGKPSRYKCYEVKKDSYEEAELECLKKLIEIVKNK